MKKSICLLVLFFAVKIIFSQQSVLWEISGNGLKSKSYLFGTIHLIDKDKFFFPKKLKKKMKTCDVLMLETNINPSLKEQLDLAQKIMLPQSMSLENYIAPAQFDSVRTYLLDTFGVSKMTYSSILKMKPIFGQMILLEKQIKKSISYEKQFYKQARKYNMDFYYLETLNEQMAFLDSIPLDAQIEDFCVNVLAGKALFAEWDAMTDCYINQDIEKLYTDFILKDTSVINYEQKLIIARNKNWITQIVPLIHNKIYFIALGAGHLPGKNGLINLLENEGYTLKPVKLK